MDEISLKPTLNATQERIVKNCNESCDLLLAKNKKYGNSIRSPAAMFSKCDVLEQIAVRCDDKLKRISNMGGLIKVIRDARNAEEDTVLDLIGYLILARVVFQEMTDTGTTQTYEEETGKE